MPGSGKADTRRLGVVGKTSGWNNRVAVNVLVEQQLNRQVSAGERRGPLAEEVKVSEREPGFVAPGVLVNRIGAAEYVSDQYASPRGRIAYT